MDYQVGTVQNGLPLTGQKGRLLPKWAPGTRLLTVEIRGSNFDPTKMARWLKLFKYVSS